MTPSNNDWTRRAILSHGAAMAGAAITLSTPSARIQAQQEVQSRRKISLGLVADVHQDVIPDGPERLNTFIAAMNERKVDAIMQMGDFAVPHRHNQPFIDLWNSFNGPRYHVLGNHDTDSGFTKAQAMTWWDMPQRHYSFDLGGWHFVVLDGNDANPKPWRGYNRYIAEDQRAWLAKDLDAATAPTIVISHQTIESDGGVANSAEVRAVLEAANRRAGWTKIHACLCGHDHTDSLMEIESIRYIQINSMSYRWLGGDHRRVRFPAHIEQAHPYVSYTAPYRDPLYTVLTLDPDTDTMSLEGATSQFIPPTPAEMEHADAANMKPVISERKLTIPTKNA